MAWWAVHTDEQVHGVYHVEADSEKEAAAMFEKHPERVGEQKLYEAYSAEVTEVETLD